MRRIVSRVDVKARWLATVVAAVLVMVQVPAVAAPKATDAVPKDEEGWMNRHTKMNDRVKEGNVDLIFVGDSITQGWEGPGKALWAEYYADRNAVNLGISGDRTYHVLWRLENGNIDGISPKLAVIMIGTNNRDEHSAEEIAEGVIAIVNKLRSDLPETKVLVLGIFPREEKPDAPYRVKMVQANELIAKAADGDMVHYLDIGAEFLDADGLLPKSIMADFLHPGKTGYRIWAETIEPRVAELMGEIAAGKTPKGFTSLFNGKDLTGWKGLVTDPKARAAMTPEQLEKAQAKADEQMRDHWKVVDGMLEYDGGGNSLCTAKDYADFDMVVDWRIHEHGDSGLYLRGSPQVQIWDPADHPEGSGGLYNNQKNPKDPLVCADNPIGEWNTFRIKMVGERVTVYLNDQLVVDDTVLENYWERDKPIYPSDQIELQHHNSQLWFRNIFIREIPRKE